MIRFTSHRFSSRYDHTFPEHSLRTPRVTRRISPVHSRTTLRSGGLPSAAHELRK